MNLGNHLHRQSYSHQSIINYLKIQATGQDFVPLKSASLCSICPLGAFIPFAGLCRHGILATAPMKLALQLHVMAAFGGEKKSCCVSFFSFPVTELTAEADKCASMLDGHLRERATSYRFSSSSRLVFVVVKPLFPFFPTKRKKNPARDNSSQTKFRGRAFE
jgi:hypothetical protein